MTIRKIPHAASKFMILLITGLLTGCQPGPQDLGLSRAEWQQLSAEQREQYQQNYAAIQTGVREAMRKSKSAAGTGDQNLPSIKVTISGESAMMPPFEHPYAFQQPLVFTLQNGQCRMIGVQSRDGAHESQFEACYKNGRLGLDVSHTSLTAQEGTLFVFRNPLWSEQLSYDHLNSNGYVRFHQITVAVSEAHS